MRKLFLGYSKISKCRVYSFKSLLIFIALNSLFLTTSFSQYPVRSQITFIPPYSPNLSDYYTGTTERFVVTLTNTDFANPLRKVRLRLNIKSNAVTLRSKDNVYYPIIELDAGVPTRLSLNDLAPYFNPNNIDASGVDYNFLSKNPRLPDGYYSFRFDVIDANTGQVLNNTLLGELNIRITTNDPPLLNLPQNKDNISFRDPINIIFNWTPRQIGISSAEYEFSLYEINDNGMPPENAPFVSQPIYQTTTYTTTLLYGPIEPQLLPGKKYAWRVKATAMSDGEAQDLFRNNGYSETYWFQLQDNCPPVQQVAATVKNGAVTISWLDNPQMYEYTVEYRKKGNEFNRWFTTTTRNNRVVITNVSDNSSYEYRVGGTCTIGAGATFSDVYAFTIPPRDSLRDKQCGIMPNINLSNKTVIDKLNIGEVVNVGDFPVMITDLTSTVGSFSGKGYITIPFLGDVRVKVKFDNVMFNTDKQLIQGFMVTTYDKTESQIVDINEIISWLSALADILSGKNSGNLLPYKQQLDSLANRVDTSNNFSSADKIETIQKIKQVTNILDSAIQNMSYLATGDNKTKALEILKQNEETIQEAYNKLNVPKNSILIQFIVDKSVPLQYHYDPNNYSSITTQYYKTSIQSSKPNYEVPHIAVVRNKNYSLYTKLYAGENNTVQKIHFAPQPNAHISANVLYTDPYNRQLQIPIDTLNINAFNNKEQTATLATYPIDVITNYADNILLNAYADSAKGPLVGQVALSVYEEQQRNLYIYIVNDTANKLYTNTSKLPGSTEIADYLNKVYKQAAVKWDVNNIKNFNTVYDIDGDGMFDSNSPDKLTDEQNGLIDKFKRTEQYNPRSQERANFYLFIIDKPNFSQLSEVKNLFGMMPPGQFGFIYLDECNTIGKDKTLWTIAHELGHGQGLGHDYCTDKNGMPVTPPEYNRQSFRDDNNLMHFENGNGTELKKYQWDVLNLKQGVKLF